MRRHELELIAALAEGILEDETEARALIESSPAHRAEYEMQKAAIDAMRSVPRAEMTDLEKAALRRDLWTALQSPSTAPAKAPWYYRWSFVAAGVLVVAVGFGAILSQQGEQDAGLSERGATELAQEESATDGELTETTSQAARAQAPPADEGDLAADDTDAFSQFFMDNALRARTGAFADFNAMEDATGGSFVAEHAPCVQSAGLEEYEAIGEVTVEQAREAGFDPVYPYLIAVPSGTELSDETPVAFIQFETCEVVFIDR